jgi:hypothetical protein
MKKKNGRNIRRTTGREKILGGLLEGILRGEGKEEILEWNTERRDIEKREGMKAHVRHTTDHGNRSTIPHNRHAYTKMTTMSNQRAYPADEVHDNARLGSMRLQPGAFTH